ncbi:hypothetical protein AAMO2058_001421500, partial [Amorphochlora amoebiformis]
MTEGQPVWGKKIVLAARILGACCATALVVIGSVGLVGTANIRQIADSIFFIFFGAILLIAEARFDWFLHYFSFLKSPLGLGLTYIFIGGRAFGWPWWGYIVMALAFAPGAINLFLAIVCYKLYQDEDAISPDSKTVDKQPYKPLLDP